MKKKKYFFISSILVILIGIISFISCQQEDNTSIDSLNNYDKVGKLHNEGLEYVFDYLKKNTPTTRSKNRANQLRELSEKAVRKFLKKKEIELPQTRSLESDTNLVEKLNPAQKVYYNRLISAVLDHSLNYKATQKEVAKIAQEIQENLSETDASPLLYGTAIAKYTLEYWYMNWEKWRVEIGGVDVFTFSVMTRAESPESSNDDFSWKDVGKADIAGGVGGAVGGAATGAMAGGVGALPGAGVGAVGGAVGGSVADAVGQLLDWL